MASIWLARRRCSASGSHPSASSPSRSRQVRSDGSAVSPASAPASAADRCLVCSMVSAPRVNDIWVQTRMPRSSTGAPAPAADAPVPAVSRPRAPIRSVNACTSIAPAYRQATVPVSILLATCQLAPSPSPRAPAGSSPLSPVPPPPPAGWPSLLPASCPPSPPAVPGCCPGCGVLAITGGRARAGVLGVAEQGTGGGQRAVLPDQLGDPGPGHAQPGADL